MKKRNRNAVIACALALSLLTGTISMPVRAESVSENGIVQTEAESQNDETVSNENGTDNSESDAEQTDLSVNADTDEINATYEEACDRVAPTLSANHPYWKLKDPVHIHDASSYKNDKGKWRSSCDSPKNRL